MAVLSQVAAHITRKKPPESTAWSNRASAWRDFGYRSFANPFSSIRHWHQPNWLPRFQRACPSTALDKYPRSMPRLGLSSRPNLLHLTYLAKHSMSANP